MFLVIHGIFVMCHSLFRIPVFLFTSRPLPSLLRDSAKSVRRYVRDILRYERGRNLLSMIFISDVVGRADDPVAFVTTPGVETHLFVAAAHVLFLALVNVLARPFVRRQSVSCRA